ncbi:MAG TPA: hypothetical protein VFU89_04820 [Rhabdochlamydiaceae bacterium]|nr:hypothetical protein [Rhabdochlamydiaceae bacterium]
MIFFDTAVFVSMTVGGTIVSTSLWKRPFYGLFSGIIQSVIAIGIKALLGKKASGLYIAYVVIYTLGVVGREALKRINDVEKRSKSVELARTLFKKRTPV